MAGLSGDPDDVELEDFCEEIADCLVKYGGLQEADARQRVIESEYCSHEVWIGTRADKPFAAIYYEWPYHWAMSILYNKVHPSWGTDPELGVGSPQDYVDAKMAKIRALEQKNKQG